MVEERTHLQQAYVKYLTNILFVRKHKIWDKHKRMSEINSNSMHTHGERLRLGGNFRFVNGPRLLFLLLAEILFGLVLQKRVMLMVLVHLVWHSAEQMGQQVVFGNVGCFPLRVVGWNKPEIGSLVSFHSLWCKQWRVDVTHV
jgi:hypothetical protein